MIKCGRHLKNVNRKKIDVDPISAPVLAFSSYLGMVPVEGKLVDEKTLVLNKSIKIGRTNFTFKIIDATKHNLNPESNSYSIAYLSTLAPMTCDLKINALNFRIIVALRRALAVLDNQALLEQQTDDQLVRLNNMALFTEPELQVFIAESEDASLISQVLEDTPVSRNDVMSVYHKFVNKNGAVDVMFHIVNFLRFLYESIGHVGLGTKNNKIFAVVNVANFDNAYWDGSCITIGNGDTMLNNLCSVDIISHELSHALVDQLGGLIYQGESGMLNESFADVFGCIYESYIYQKFNADANPDNDLLGEFDYLVGEDAAIGLKALRDMENPEQGLYPQPRSYKGEYWPTGSDDNGGVHTGSSVGNRCFYLISARKGMLVAIRWFYDCLRGLPKNSSYSAFATRLYLVSRQNVVCKESLQEVSIPFSSKIPKRRNFRRLKQTKLRLAHFETARAEHEQAKTASRFASSRRQRETPFS